MKVPAWSFSALNNFETCPKQFFHYRVAKDVKEPENTNNLWGQRFHAAADRFIKSGTLDPEFAQYKDYFATYVARIAPGVTVRGEQQLAIGRDLKPCAWFDKSTWSRSILDVMILDKNTETADVHDHKTGKIREDSGQLKQFALTVFIHHPWVNRVNTHYEWIQHLGKPEQTSSETFYREDIMDIWDFLLPKLDRFVNAFKTEAFPARPSGLCKRYCAVSTCTHCGV